jgi:hypothetical protein
MIKEAKHFAHPCHWEYWVMFHLQGLPAFLMDSSLVGDEVWD